MTEAAPPRFSAGDAVRVRQEVAAGNPRTPRYARGKVGVVAAVHGSMANPLDHRGVYPPLYTIVFPISAVFPGRGVGTLHVDVHEDWLEPA
ncbi:MAG: SH3-like domain-containing protein [Candidatus Rokuibacteriota bacterium]